MRNYLKAEMRRFLYSPVVWILLISHFCLTLSNTFVIGFMYGNRDWVIEIHKSMGNSFTQMMNSTSEISKIPITCSSFAEFLKMNISSNVVLITALFVGLFCTTGEKNGYIKNILPNIKKKDYVFGNIVMIVLYSLVCVITLLGAVEIAYVVFFIKLPAVTDGSLFCYILMEFGIITSATIVCYGIIEMFKNHIAGLVVAITYSSGIGSIIYLLYNSIVSNGPKIELFLPLGIITALDFTDAKTYLYAFINIVVYSIINITLIMWIRKKRDI